MLFRSKIATQHTVNTFYRQVDDLLPARAAQPQLLLIASPWGSPFVGQPYPFLINDHGPNAHTLYAADTGADSYLVQLAHPERAALRIQPPPPDLPHAPKSHVRGTVVPLGLARGQRVCIDATLQPAAAGRVLTSFLTVGGRTVSRPAISETSGIAAHSSWSVSPRDLHAGPQLVTVGFTAGAAERWEQRLSAGPVVASTAAASIAVQAPGRAWHLSNPSRPTWQEADPAGPLRVSVRNCA